MDLLCLAAGAATPLAFAPFGWYLLAPLTLAVPMRAWLDAVPRRAAWRGWLFGLGLFGVGVSWVQVSIHQFGLPIAVFSVSVTVVFVAFMALYPALAGWLAVRLSGGLTPASRLLIVFPSAWVLVEWLRGWLFTGFPWLTLGYGQIDGPLAGLAPLGGVWLVSLALALSAGLLAHACAPGGRRRGALALALLVLWVAAGGLARIDWTEPAGPALETAIVQGAVPQAEKWLPEQRGPTLALYRDLTEPHWGADLVVWPETAIPAFRARVAPYLERLAARARAAGTGVLIGLPVRGRGDARYYNTLVGFGTAEGTYRKRHLVPFGEYLPFARALEGVLDFLRIPMSQFSAGARAQPLITVAGTPVGASICYEAAFAREVRRALPEAALLVNVSNDAWFGDSLAPAQHLEIARMRSRESGRDMLRATNTGISAMIDARGVVLQRSPQFRAHVLAGRVEPRRGATPYVVVGDLPVLTLALAGVLAPAARRRGGR